MHARTSVAAVLMIAAVGLAQLLAGCSSAPAANNNADASHADTGAMAHNIVTEEVPYEVDGVTCKGFVAWDSNVKGKRPAVLVVHEWWGQTDYPRKRVRMLAELGYTAFAVDMYGNGETTDAPDRAGELASGVFIGMPATAARFTTAMDWLKKHETVDPAHIAAIGYCFGGAVVLAMARNGAELDGVVSFHGSLGTPTPAQPGAVKARILVCHGEADKLVPAADVEAFKAEMKDAGADMKFIGYPDAMHAFTNPDATAAGEKLGLPVAYNEAADKGSWTAMKAFFADIFGN